MNAAVLADSIIPELIGNCERRLLHNFADDVEQWANAVRCLNVLEDAELLDAPTQEILDRHKGLITRLLFLGKLISLTTQHSEFPDKATAAIVSATQSLLQDKLTMWHGPTPAPEREEILQRVFGEP